MAASTETNKFKIFRQGTVLPLFVSQSSQTKGLCFANSSQEATATGYPAAAESAAAV